MPTPAAYGSLDELVTASLADFADCGIDCFTKLTLLEAAWTATIHAETIDAFFAALNGAASANDINQQLSQLVECGIMISDGGSYRLSETPTAHLTLNKLRAFWSDRELRYRAAPLLRYRLAHKA